jgi:hypothetical protein
MLENVAKSVLEATVDRLGPYLVTEEERPGLGVGREIAAERALMAEARDVVALWAEDLKPEAIAFWMQRGTEMARKEGREISREVLRSSAVKWEREALAKEAAVEAAKVAAVAGNGNGGASTVRDEKGRYAAVRGGVAAAGGGGRPGASGNGMRMVERRKDAGEILAAAGM